MALTRKQIMQIENFASNYYKKLDTAHGLWHMYKTVELAEHVARRENANVAICKTGAFLHQFHPNNIKVVKRFLIKIKVEPKTIKQLVHCVECVENKTIKNAKTIEAKIIYDADKLQAIGSLGIARALYSLSKSKIDRITYKLPADADLWSILKWIRNDRNKIHNLFNTKTAKQLALKLHKEENSFFNKIEKSSGKRI
jgi:uncharacterized protein